jgi:predicted dehydrogenase
VDAVYIATPHDSHAALTLACLDAGKPVLCEKPLTPTAAQTRAVTARAQARGVTLVEALWTAYLPLYMQIKQWLQEGEIGELRVIESSFCFDVPYQPESRLFDPQRAGGALLDIGIYNLAVTRLAMAAAFGHCPEPTTLQAHGLRTRSGVDQCVQGLLHFPTGSSARFICAFDRRSANACRLRGSRGEILVPQDFWQATRATLRRPGRPPLTVERPWAVNGFEYEVADTMHCVRTGRLQSAVMPHAESLALVRWLDALRRHMGVRYPFE